jgi:uncharacterized protein YqeY
VNNGDGLRGRLRASLTAAMKRRDAPAVSVLRSALAAIDNAEAVDPSHAPKASAGPIAGAVRGIGAAEVPRRQLSAHEIAAIVQAEAERREEAAAEYDRLGRAEHAARLRVEAAMLRERLG